MLAVQHRLPLASPRVRSVRRAFSPSCGNTRYRLPRDVADRLSVALTPFRNRDSAYALALFLCRFHSVPRRVSGSFVIDRRALTGSVDSGKLQQANSGQPSVLPLDLTEARIRGAIRTLEAVGFLDRAMVAGSAYKPTEHGLRRKPVPFVFGPDYFAMLDAANKRAAAARGRRLGVVKSTGAGNARSPSATDFRGGGATTSGTTISTKSPKSSEAVRPSVNLGDLVKRHGIPPKPFVPDPGLEAALERLKQGFRRSGGG